MGACSVCQRPQLCDRKGYTPRERGAYITCESCHAWFHLLCLADMETAYSPRICVKHPIQTLKRLEVLDRAQQRFWVCGRCEASYTCFDEHFPQLLQTFCTLGRSQ
jgi:hypothetical protein